MDPFVEPLRNQFLGLFFRFCHFLLLISNLLFLCHLLYFHHSWLFFFFFSFSFFCFFTSHFFLSFFFFSSSLCFFYPNFPCFGLYCFSHSSRHLIIIISSVLQLILGLWHTSHRILKITLYF